MTLHHAKSVFIRDRLDTQRPQLRWFKRSFYTTRKYFG